MGTLAHTAESPRVARWSAEALELLPLRVVCAIGAIDSLVALTSAIAMRPQPVSIAVGCCWLVAWSWALAMAPRWAATVARHAWALVPLGALAVVPAAFDGGYPGNLATQPMWLVLVLAALAGWRLTLLAGVALSLAKLAVFLATGTSLDVLLPGGGEPTEATTATVAPLAIALLGIVFVAALRHVLATLAPDAPAAGAEGSVPEPAGDLVPPRLSPAELAVVRLLASGLTPKQIAHERGTSVETVRTQIKRAKRTMQARTLDELVATTWRTS